MHDRNDPTPIDRASMYSVHAMQPQGPKTWHQNLLAPVHLLYQSSSCPTFPYVPLLPLPLRSLLDWETILPIHPPTPSLARRPLLRLIGLSSAPRLISGGSMSKPGMASPAPKAPGPIGVPLRMSMEDGDPTPMIDSRSACGTGVGIAVVASPKRAFISSRRTLAVSGYKK